MARINRVLDSLAEQNRLKEKIAELEAIVSKSTVTYSSTPKGRGGKQKDDDYVKFIEMKEKYEDELQRFVDTKVELEQEIDCVEPSIVRTILKYRFVDCLDLAEIPDRVYLSRRQVERHIKTGIKSYDEMYNS